MSQHSCREALKLWKDYDRARQELTARLYNGRDDPDYIQSLLDENDQLRQQALRLTEEVLRDGK